MNGSRNNYSEQASQKTNTNAKCSLSCVDYSCESSDWRKPCFNKRKNQKKHN